MTKHSSIHEYVNWAKERLDEMDASVAALEERVRHQKADAKAKGEKVIADLKAKRNAFAANVKKQADAGAAAWEHAKSELESSWQQFECELDAYLDAADAQIEEQQALFAKRVAAQERAWREAGEKLAAEAQGVAAARRAEFDAAVKQMQADAAAAKVHLERLKTAQRETWSALRDALAQSRKAFDHANQRAADAFQRAVV